MRPFFISRHQENTPFQTEKIIIALQIDITDNPVLGLIQNHNEKNMAFTQSLYDFQDKGAGEMMKKYYLVVPVIITLFAVAVFSISYAVSSSTGKLSDEKEQPLNIEADVDHVNTEYTKSIQSQKLNRESESVYRFDQSDEKNTAAEKTKDAYVEPEHADQNQHQAANASDNAGNYTDIEQQAATSGGTTKRHIDTSSPGSGAYLYENMTVVGSSEITETFTMDNSRPGSKATSDWWDPF